jgi:hypothetical protein
VKRVLAAGLAGLLLAGCGGGSKGNGEAAKSASDIIADAAAAAAQAPSVRVASSGTSAFTLDLRLAAGSGGKGTITTNGLTFQIIRIGDAAYVKGNATFWRQFGRPTAAQLLHGRWLKVSATSGPLSSFTPFTDIGKLFDAVISTHGKLKKGDTTKIDGQSAIGIVDTTKGGTLYVATTGKPYPLEVTQGGKGKITFTEWGKSVQLHAPPDAVDLSQLTGGG